MINKDIQQAFNKAAKTYKNSAVICQATGERLLSRLDYMRCDPQVILDVGCGLGQYSMALAERYPKAQVVALDFAEKMIQEGQKLQTQPTHSWLIGNMTSLPFSAESVDMIFANQSIQDIENLSQLFKEFHRILRPNGVLLFATLGPDSFKELKAAWACVDTYGHINELKDLHILGDGLMSQQFMQPVMDKEEMSLHYREPQKLMNDLKEQGSYNIHPLRRRGLMGIDALDYLFEHLEKQSKEAGKIALTYEVIYGHAWRGEKKSQYNAETGETFISLDKLRRSSI